MNKIFGIGLGRSGSTSLTKALQRLGFRVKHHPKVPIFYETVKSHNGVVNGFTLLVFEELDKMYPNSKFILTLRNFSSWMISCENYMNNTRRGWQKDLRIKVFGVDGWDYEKFRKSYTQHIKRVLKYFNNRKDLLILNICAGEGYEKLCPFLGKKILNEKFPHKNKG